jgi:hypothetical protein
MASVVASASASASVWTAMDGLGSVKDLETLVDIIIVVDRRGVARRKNKTRGGQGSVVWNLRKRILLLLSGWSTQLVAM